MAKSNQENKNPINPIKANKYSILTIKNKCFNERFACLHPNNNLF
jgi:hypothetical protein